MYMFVAPTSCMIAISRRRAKTVKRIVFEMMTAAAKISTTIMIETELGDRLGETQHFCNGRLIVLDVRNVAHLLNALRDGGNHVRILNAHANRVRQRV